MSLHSVLLDKIKQLENASPHRDGFDDAYIQGFRDLAQEYDCFGGEGDGGITENYIEGLKDAIQFVSELTGDME
jgi:hypothetical protein